MGTAKKSSSGLTDLQLRVLQQFRLIYGSVRQHFREVESSCNISGSQVWILRDVQSSPGTGISELAKRLSIHQSTCSQLVEKLVVAGLVEKARSAEDQRRVGLKVTRLGRQLLEKAPGPAEGMLPEALRQMPDVSLRTLQVNLDQLISHLAERNDKDAKRPLADL
jgi:DNA-binding MarR family transcriptional regulator